ncbi:MAG: hypothetical protein UGF89_09990 [Acutalibacteraceae bacterium]|nr:hypothetical protein [Acutalibacteraceae bacterium]
MGRFTDKELGKLAASSKSKYWIYLGRDGAVIKWACKKCGHEIKVDALKDSITRHTKCEACGDEKFAKELKQREEMALYDDD